ncbi:MAG: RluA family pseudouridine synthase [Vampirovibrio sp.]|nr:RluA family pseudouridine synthase [Vampirovibrio sp.]
MTIEHLTFIVTEEAQLERLDKFLAQELTHQFSRERLKQLIQEGAVCIDNSPAEKASIRLNEGDTVTLTIPEPVPLILDPQDIPLDVVFEDDHLLIVNKPRGMLTHPTGRQQRDTLVNAVLFYCRGNLSGINGVIRPGIVHRLDRDTCGLLMVAKTDIAHRGLAAQLKAKTARREYIALAQGNFSSDTGMMDAPIGRNPKQRDKMCVIDSGRPAVTHWQVKERIHQKFTLLHLRLETGRTHQIRVHMAHLGHSIIGDTLYGSGIEKQLKLNTPGQLLQAFRLQVQHPVSNEALEFEIPVDTHILKVVDQLKSDG